MFSTGSGSHDGSNYPTQWALNPSAYQNVANDQVDWAALAQQWIMMKETAPPEHQMPQAPPPPNIGSSKKDVIDEGGEAPMDVDNEKEENDWNDTAGSGQDWNDWQQNSWSWGSNWNGPSGVPPPNSVNSSSKSALLPTPFSHYSAQNIESNSNLDYQNASSNDFNSGYWTNNSGGSRNKGPSKQRMTRKGPMASENRIDNSSESVTLDAAKRRQLPAWIREGLEKMEREKLKQIERERERVEREVYLTRKKEETEGAIKLLQASGLPVKSKFDSDSEDSSSEHEVRTKKTPSPERSHSPPPMSEEQRMQQRMLMVRRAMTEVLLEVTSSEIEIICQEELIRFRSRHSAKKMAQYGTPGVGSTNDSLGLGMYGGESESSSDESDSDQPPNSVSNDSDTQLKETIKRRRAEFAKTERDIENRLNKDKESKTSSGDKSDGAQTPEWPDSGGERDHSQVDTAQTHGSGPLKSRRHSQKSSSRTPPRKDQKSTPDSRDSRQKSKKQSSSSSNSDSEESSCSESSSSTSSHETRRKEIRTSRRGRSRSTETDKSRKKNNHSRSVSNASDSDDRSHSRHRDRSYSSRRSDRSRRDRERDSRRERSRTRSRTRRSRSRSRERVQRVRRTRSRSRSRSSRRRRSRSQSDRRRDHRSPHGGKRTRR